MTLDPSNRGWTCPRCGRIYAPSVLECDPCNAQILAAIGGSIRRTDLGLLNDIAEQGRAATDAIDLFARATK